MTKRALISVYDKTGILEIAKKFQEKNIEIISSGGTFSYLKDNGIEAIEINEITNFNEMLDGRVKTLHPNIHGGILACRDNELHMNTLENEKIKTIDYVIVNLYPFFDKVRDEEINFEEKIEFIDIGGPTLLRGAAKNFKFVTVLSDTNDYSEFLDKLENNNIDLAFKQKLAAKVFNLMSAYDSAIANFLGKDDDLDYLSISYKKSNTLRYGENPHQKASYFKALDFNSSMNSFELLSGKELSYNNIKDMDIAYKVVCEFEEIACCALKHNTPCGVALGQSPDEAYKKAYECDTISIFGGIVAFNKCVDLKTAVELKKIFLEVIIAPDFDEDAVKLLKEKKNLRLVKCKSKPNGNINLVSVDGGILVQDEDKELLNKIEVKTKIAPTDEQLEDLIFAMKIVKYVKSNAIVVAKDKMAVGIGGGEVNRIWAATKALERGKNGVVLASDAFFPFDDTIKEAVKYGIKAIIQPGGSIRDEDSIKVCDENNISMVFTHMRHFKH
ncbi:MAG: bifunctional phosphoribosylaminoimidazolecarboxamide formyltransferase/IMP cyclohydrolase [Sarcina sp.]